MLRDPSGKLALGFGLIGLAGFGTDYPADTASILFAAVPNGFGRIYTDYRETKIPIAFAYQVTPKLALGGSLNVYVGEFGVAPLPYKFFDPDAAGNRYYPEAGKLDRRWAVSAQFGFDYQASPVVSVGASITLPQNFAARVELDEREPRVGRLRSAPDAQLRPRRPDDRQLRRGPQAGQEDPGRHRRHVHEVQGCARIRRPRRRQQRRCRSVRVAQCLDVQGRRAAPGDRQARRARRLQLQPDAAPLGSRPLGDRRARDVPAPLLRGLRPQDVPVPGG